MWSATIYPASLTCSIPVKLKFLYVLAYNAYHSFYCIRFYAGDEFVLQMDLISHIFDHMVVDDALVRIILPEGASNIEVETPYAVTRLPDSLHFTYLDVKGRPVVEIAAKNLVENHIQPFKVIFFERTFR